jgi:hypothetical protein
MNTKQIRLTTTASTRENTTTTRKNTALKTQIIKDVKQNEKLNMLFNKPTVMDALRNVMYGFCHFHFTSLLGRQRT